MASLLRRLLDVIAPSPVRAARLFAAANISFLGIDIAIAHLANDFARPMEWAPVVFSAIATPLLLPGALGSERRVFRLVDRAIALGAILVGVVGMVLHLESGFFEAQTLHHLVYSAPFVAPISYAGLGLLLVLVHSEEASGPSFGPWVLFLALGGFVGNLGLSLLDHAQNGFFRWSEWIPVVAAAYAVSFLAVTLSYEPRALPRELCKACTIVLAIAAVVGVVGAALHLEADLHRPTTATLRDRLVFGAPAFAPLLFVDLALLALLGLWASDCASVRAAPAGPPGDRAPKD